jgi:hypothetical protein
MTALDESYPKWTVAACRYKVLPSCHGSNLLVVEIPVYDTIFCIWAEAYNQSPLTQAGKIAKLV